MSKFRRICGLFCAAGILMYAPVSIVQAQTINNTDNDVRHSYSGTVIQNENVNTEGKKSLAERIHDILHPPVAEQPAAGKSDPDQAEELNGYYNPVDVPSADEKQIMGGAVATREQCVRFLLKRNPNPLLTVSPEELVDYYYEEGSREGIRPDIAFAQALLETGYFRYGGTVIPSQNNYCGLGTTSRTVRGAFFADARLGVRAHIQHLLAYVSTKEPHTAVEDPRYQLVRKTYGENTLSQWSDLNGRWAVPGNNYGQTILATYHSILNS